MRRIVACPGLARLGLGWNAVEVAGKRGPERAATGNGARWMALATSRSSAHWRCDVTLPGIRAARAVAAAAAQQANKQ